MDSVNWTRELDEMIREAVARYGSNDWVKVCQKLRSQQITPEQCQARWENVLRDQTVKGPWSEEEDAILRSLVEKFGPKKWSTIASYINGRIGKQCRERWLNHLSPAVSKDVWTEEEDEILINAQIQMGNKWSYISKLLPGRSENAVKNRYNSIASRNGVRKKRLGNFVNRSPASRGNLLRLQIPSKVRSTTQRSTSQESTPPALDSSYAELLEKATQQMNARTAQRQQRSSLQLPELTFTHGDPNVSNPSHTVPEFSESLSHHESSDMFMFPSVNSPLRNSFLSTDMNQFNFGVVDTSEMTLPVVNPPPFSSPRSIQDEEASLQQIDSFLLSGNTIMGSSQMPEIPALTQQNEDTVMYSSLRDSFPSADPAISLPSNENSIAPVKLRSNARINTLNRGVYSSWDREGTEGSATSATGQPSLSIGFSRQSAKYESLDLLRLLNESDSGQNVDLSLGVDNPLLMEEEVKEPILAPLDISGAYYS